MTGTFSFPDAKMMKDVLKYHVIGYFAHNVA